MWTLIGLAAAAIAFGVVPNYKVKAEERKLLSVRPALSDDEIFDTYYDSLGAPKETVLELWREICSTLQVDAGRVRPEDRFGKDIGRYFLVSADLDSLVAKALERAKRGGVQKDVNTIKTVDDYIRFFVLV